MKAVLKQASNEVTVEAESNSNVNVVDALESAAAAVAAAEDAGADDDGTEDADDGDSKTLSTIREQNRKKLEAMKNKMGFTNKDKNKKEYEKLFRIFQKSWKWTESMNMERPDMTDT